ncbi:DUF759 family protein [Borrelia duttonii]|uniref:Uncharacterized conserved protein n=1 Tax=Borrelia duttonii (strain Ly) TaxID=412419 RepID=B5RNY0_BORDL|nr:uncharacterized conserved protein [Borrelia duttonii Ly]
MNNTGFTIKFKGVLDHASTKKSLEKDISILEKVLKPKRTRLDSTEKILKHNLKEKKAELAKQNKYEKLKLAEEKRQEKLKIEKQKKIEAAKKRLEKLRLTKEKKQEKLRIEEQKRLDNIEKFKLEETKRLMSQGMRFKKAKEAAIKRSSMTQEELMDLEYKSLKKQNGIIRRTIRRTGRAVLEIGKIAVGTALGQVFGTTFQGGIGDAFNYAKRSIINNANVKKMNVITSRVFKSQEKAQLNNILQTIPGFNREIDREEFLNYAGILRKDLESLGQNNEENLNKAVAFAARLKSTGVVNDNASAIAVVSEFLQGKGGSLYNVMGSFSKLTRKYNERGEMEYDLLSLSQALSFRTETLKKIIDDWNTLEFPKYASTEEKLKDDLIEAEDSFAKTTSELVKPLLKKLSQLATWLQDFTFKTHILDPMIKGLTSFFGNIYEWFTKMVKIALKQILPDWFYKWVFSEEPKTNKDHSPLPTTDTGTKLEKDASVKTP